MVRLREQRPLKATNPVTDLRNILDIGLLREMVQANYIRTFHHDNGDLVGYNYTEQAQFERFWNDATQMCRGLIVDTSWNIIARPFPKFFNLGEQPEVDARYRDMPFTIAEKHDGSLGILYQWEGQQSIATRGSFHSEQAQWATEHIRGHPPIKVEPGVTNLYEIIYPENRIVVDYGNRRGLYHLASIDIETGKDVDLGQVIRHGALDAADLKQVMDSHPRDNDGNKEGFVLVYDDGHRIKVKYPEYVRRHRFKAYMSNRSVWESLSAGDSLAELIVMAPDEFHGWLGEIVGSFYKQFACIMKAAATDFDLIAEEVGTHDRREFAALAVKSEFSAILFKMLDGADTERLVWKLLRPDEIVYAEFC